MPTPTYFDLLDQAHQAGADSPEELQRAQMAQSGQQVDPTRPTLPSSSVEDNTPNAYKRLYTVSPGAADTAQPDPLVDLNSILKTPTDTNKNAGTYDFNSAIKSRFSTISDMGQSANLNSQAAALKNQETTLSAQVNAAKTAAQMPNGAPGVTTTGVSGQYNNGTFVPSKNPRSAQEAIAWAQQAAASGDSGWYRRCLAFVAQAYGLPASGTNYAIDAFTRLPATEKHTDRNPQPGALMFWNTGSRAGHVALYLGNGMIASNDIGGNGKIAIVPADQIDKKWGAKYVGWSLPDFASTPR